LHVDRVPKFETHDSKHIQTDVALSSISCAQSANAINYAMLSVRLPCRMNYHMSVSSQCSFFTPLS